MGCAYCTYYSDPQVEKHREALKRMGINQYIINYMHDRFSYFDVNRSGLLNWSEILAILYEDDGPFIRRLLRKFYARSKKHTNHTTFLGFLLGMWSILSLDLTFLPHFVFELYDEKMNGFLNAKSVKTMIQETYHNTVNKSEQPLELELSAARGDKLAEIDFTHFCRDHTYALKPIFDVIFRLKSKLIGSAFWERETRKRRALFGDEYMSLDQSLDSLTIDIEYQKVQPNWRDVRNNSWVIKTPR